ETVPRTIWSDLRGSMPRRKATSTVSSNFAVAFSLTRLSASRASYTLSSVTFSDAAFSRFPTFVVTSFPFLRGRCAPRTAPSASNELRSFDLHSHTSSGSFDDLHGGVEIVRREVLHLLLGDLARLILRDRTDLVAVRLGRTLLETGGLLDKHGGRRRLRLEGERAVVVHRELDRDDRALLRTRRFVVGLDELHDVHAVLTERRTDRRCCGRATRDRK